MASSAHRISAVGTPAQALAPDHDAQMGTSGANLTIPNGSAAHSATAPDAGVILVSLPAGVVVRVRIGFNAVAVATDHMVSGASTWAFPVTKGERVSLYGDASTGTATVCMAA